MEMEKEKIEISELQLLLSEKQRRGSALVNNPNLDENKPKIIGKGALKAQKNASLEDFIAMVAMVTSKSLKEYGAELVPDEGSIIADPSLHLEHPKILYKVVSRKPKFELKARYNEELVEILDEATQKKRYAHNYTQRQDAIVQFDIIAGDYKTANKVMDIFESSIFNYSGFFKKNGVAELYFLKTYTDSNLDKYRQHLSVRSIQYFVEIEKLHTVFDTSIEAVDV